MSMASYEPDRDYSDETRYDEYRERFSSGLCVLCKDDVAIEYDDLCKACIEECIGEVLLEEIEAA